MLGRREKFLRILSIELEDLEDHIHALTESYRQKASSREIPEHVCLENIAVLQNEELAFHHFDRIVAAMRPDECSDLPALVSELTRRFDEELQASGLAPAASYLVSERMGRVTDYVVREESLWHGVS